MKEYYYDEYLMHHGVKGMKWGVRRARSQATTSDIRRRVDSTKDAYKAAKKAYNKSFDKAYNYSSAHSVGQWTNKKKSTEADQRWDDVINKADAVNKAKVEYKQAKADYKQAKAAEKRLAKESVKTLSASDKVEKGMKTVENLLNASSGPNGPKIKITPNKRLETHAERSQRESMERRNKMGKATTIREERERNQRYNI